MSDQTRMDRLVDVARAAYALKSFIEHPGRGQFTMVWETNEWAEFCAVLEQAEYGLTETAALREENAELHDALASLTRWAAERDKFYTTQIKQHGIESTAGSSCLKLRNRLRPRLKAARAALSNAVKTILTEITP